jgi:hypothetical protein
MIVLTATPKENRRQFLYTGAAALLTLSCIAQASNLPDKAGALDCLLFAGWSE